MASTIVTLSADEASLLRAFQKIQAAQDKTDQGFKKNKDQAQEAARKIAEDMEAAGDATTRAFNDGLKELRKMGPEGRAAAAEVEKHLRETGKAGRKSFQDVVAELGKLDEEAAKVANNAMVSFEKTAEATDKAFGSSAIEDVKQYATQLLSVGAAIGMISTAFQKVREEQTKSLESLMGQADPEKRLAQIATSGADLDAMINKADELATKYGIGRDQARGLIFSARSEGFEPDVEMIARASQVVDVTSQASLAGVLGRQFGGEGGSTEQRLSAVLAAAEKSAFNFETVGKNVIKSASATRAAGSDMAETLATNATMANLIGDTAGDRVKAFAALASLNPMLQGKGVMGAVATLEQMPEDARAKVLGQGQEVNEAYRLLLENRDAIQQMATAVRADISASGAGGGALAGKIAIVEGSDRFQARRGVSSAAINREIITEQAYSGEEARFAAGVDQMQTDAIRKGTDPLMRAAGEFVAERMRTGGLSAEASLAGGSTISGMTMTPIGPLPLGMLRQGLQGMGLMSPASGSNDASQQIVDKLESIRRNTSQAPVITGTALQSPVAAAAAP